MPATTGKPCFADAASETAAAAATGGSVVITVNGGPSFRCPPDARVDIERAGAEPVVKIKVSLRPPSDDDDEGGEDGGDAPPKLEPFDDHRLVRDTLGDLVMKEEEEEEEDGPRVYRCPVCATTWPAADALKAHVRSAHKIIMDSNTVEDHLVKKVPPTTLDDLRNGHKEDSDVAVISKATVRGVGKENGGRPKRPPPSPRSKLQQGSTKKRRWALATVSSNRNGGSCSSIRGDAAIFLEEEDSAAIHKEQGCSPP